MNRILLVAALLVAVSACAPAGPTNTANVPTNTNASPVATPARVTEADALTHEKQIWDALKAKNYDAFAALLADDQIYVTSDGVHDREASLKGVRNFELTDYAISDVKLVNVDKDLHIVVYKATVKGSSGGKALPPDAAEYASTAWVNRGGKWLVAYHQDSMAKPPPPMPTPGASPHPAASPAATPAASATASPSASPAAAVTATDLEKQVWDALQRADWDAFAAFLAPDHIEVFHYGIHDRAHALEGIKHIDFKGATLSDFKEVKLNPNATLVTYIAKSKAKGFNPAGERHTTIWANRSGKWIGVFHHGTDIE